jgi:hypothetical protein
MNKAIEVAALAGCLSLSPLVACAADSSHVPPIRHKLIRRNHRHPATFAPNAIGPPKAAHAVPDWTFQYGVVSNPRGASGSFGAMLEGRNPAPNGIP